MVNGNDGSKDNTIKEKIMERDKKQLNEEDFEIVTNLYALTQIQKLMILQKLGLSDGYKANNQGYISGNTSIGDGIYVISVMINQKFE